MIDLWRLFRLPTPKDLGWSEGNFLPMDKKDGQTWENYYMEMRKRFPFRWWLAERLPRWIRRKFISPLSDFKYWIVSHIIPSRRFHMLDLRQPHSKIDDCDYYCWGWVDRPQAMLYAMFNILGEYLNKEKPYDLATDYSLEEIEADQQMKRQHENLKEARELWHWWCVDRKQFAKDKDAVLRNWIKAKKEQLPETEEYWHELRKMGEEFDAKEDEMIARLMKIRRGLWT